MSSKIMSDNSGQGQVRVRVFRLFGRRPSSGQDLRGHQEVARDDQDSTDSDNSTEDSPNRGRRSRCKKIGGGSSASIESKSGSSSSSGTDFRQQGTGSGSDSSSNDSPSNSGVTEAGASSDSGSGGSSGSEQGSVQRRSFSAFLRPFSAPFAGAGRASSCCCDLAPHSRRQGCVTPSTLHKVFQGLHLSTNSLARKSLSSSSLSLPSCNHHHHRHPHHHHSSYTLSETAGSVSSGSSNPSSDKQESKDKRSKKAPGRILRSPVSYTYVRGISGLPTQRVPRYRLPPSYGSHYGSPALPFDR